MFNNPFDFQELPKDEKRKRKRDHSEGNPQKRVKTKRALNPHAEKFGLDFDDFSSYSDFLKDDEKELEEMGRSSEERIPGSAPKVSLYKQFTDSLDSELPPPPFHELQSIDVHRSPAESVPPAGEMSPSAQVEPIKVPLRPPLPPAHSSDLVLSPPSVLSPLPTQNAKTSPPANAASKAVCFSCGMGIGTQSPVFHQGSATICERCDSKHKSQPHRQFRTCGFCERPAMEFYLSETLPKVMLCRECHEFEDSEGLLIPLGERVTLSLLYEKKEQAKRALEELKEQKEKEKQAEMERASALPTRHRIVNSPPAQVFTPQEPNESSFSPPSARAFADLPLVPDPVYPQESASIKAIFPQPGPPGLSGQLTQASSPPAEDPDSPKPRVNPRAASCVQFTTCHLDYSPVSPQPRSKLMMEPGMFVGGAQSLQPGQFVTHKSSTSPLSPPPMVTMRQPKLSPAGFITKPNLPLHQQVPSASHDVGITGEVGMPGLAPGTLAPFHGRIPPIMPKPGSLLSAPGMNLLGSPPSAPKVLSPIGLSGDISGLFFSPSPKEKKCNNCFLAWCRLSASMTKPIQVCPACSFMELAASALQACSWSAAELPAIPSSLRGAANNTAAFTLAVPNVDAIVLRVRQKVQQEVQVCFTVNGANIPLKPNGILCSAQDDRVLVLLQSKVPISPTDSLELSVFGEFLKVEDVKFRTRHEMPTDRTKEKPEEKLPYFDFQRRRPPAQPAAPPAAADILLDRLLDSCPPEFSVLYRKKLEGEGFDDPDVWSLFMSSETHLKEVIPNSRHLKIVLNKMFDLRPDLRE